MTRLILALQKQLQKHLVYLRDIGRRLRLTTVIDTGRSPSTATLDGPGVVPPQGVIPRGPGEDAVDEEGVGVGRVDADAVTRGNV